MDQTDARQVEMNMICLAPAKHENNISACA